VRVRVERPAWLVLGDSYSRGWSAWCGPTPGKERTLGDPIPIDGFANGWRVDRSCRFARFAFTPQSFADGAYWLSVIGGATVLALLVAWAVRRRRGLAVQPAVELPRWGIPPLDPVRRLGWRGALLAAALAAVVGGFVLAWRAGAVLGPAVLVLAALGITARRLIGLATLGLAALVVVYLVYPSPDSGGFYFPYALHYINAHWIAVGAVCALGFAAVIMARDIRADPPGGNGDSEGGVRAGSDVLLPDQPAEAVGGASEVRVDR
jgi:hypothetical protein